MLTSTTSQRNHRKSPIKDVLETVACRRSKILTVVLILSSIQCATALCCAYLWFPINCWLDGFTTNIHHWQAIVPTCAFNSAVYSVFSTTIGQLLAGQCSVVQYIKMWSRLNCWLVRVPPTKMSQLMADRWSVRYVPVASVQLLTLTPPIDVQVYSLVYWHLLSSLSCVSSPMWRLLWQRARMTCAQDPLPLPPHTTLTTLRVPSTN